jgi:hypothetical protein
MVGTANGHENTYFYVKTHNELNKLSWRAVYITRGVMATLCRGILVTAAGRPTHTGGASTEMGRPQRDEHLVKSH